MHTFENDTGPDDCNHAQNGMFILYDALEPGGGRRVEGAGLMNVAPSVLEYLGLPLPADFQGVPLRQRAAVGQPM